MVYNNRSATLSTLLPSHLSCVSNGSSERFIRWGTIWSTTEFKLASNIPLSTDIMANPNSTISLGEIGFMTGKSGSDIGGSGKGQEVVPLSNASTRPVATAS